VLGGMGAGVSFCSPDLQAMNAPRIKIPAEELKMVFIHSKVPADKDMKIKKGLAIR
jgi:hypothetical protein